MPTNPTTAKCVVIADDSASVRDRFRTAVESAGHRAITVKSAAELFARVRADLERLDLLVIDLRLPHCSGAELIGTVRVQVNIPRAEVFIDGQSVGLAPISEEIYVDPSSHVIEARADGYLPAQESFLASKGKTSDVSLTLVAPKGANKTVIIAGGAVAGAAIIAGAVLLGVSTAKGSTLSSLQDEVKATGGCASETAGGKCEELRSAGQSKATLGNAGLWTLVGGGVVGVATLIYGVAGGAKAPRTGVRVTPIVTGDGGGLIIGGAF